tara:strand:+ start:366 stop:557 length:192 start_codon:yes stop_codon:yes gene_type:complete
MPMHQTIQSLFPKEYPMEMKSRVSTISKGFITAKKMLDIDSIGKIIELKVARLVIILRNHTQA